MTEMTADDKAELLKRLHADGYSGECVRLLGHARIVFGDEPVITGTDGSRWIAANFIRVEDAPDWVESCVRQDANATDAPHNWENRVNAEWWVRAYERSKARVAA